MTKWVCTPCGYVYDPDFGDPENDIPPGTPWDDVPDDWLCPECSLGKEFFEPLEE
jgi:rubredoxin